MKDVNVEHLLRDSENIEEHANPTVYKEDIATTSPLRQKSAFMIRKKHNKQRQTHSCAPRNNSEASTGAIFTPDVALDKGIWKCIMKNQFDDLWENVGLENVNYQRECDGTTALMGAALHHDREVELKVLLRLGSDIGLKNRDGKTAMDYARSSHNKRAIEILNPVCRDRYCYHFEEKLLYETTGIVCTDCGLVLGELNPAVTESSTEKSYENELSTAIASLSINHRRVNDRHILDLWHQVERMRQKEADKKKQATLRAQKSNELPARESDPLTTELLQKDAEHQAEVQKKLPALLGVSLRPVVNLFNPSGETQQSTPPATNQALPIEQNYVEGERVGRDEQSITDQVEAQVEAEYEQEFEYELV